MSRIVWSIVAGAFAVVCLFLFQFVKAAREAALASRTKSPLNQLHLAFHNYHETYGCFPPAYVVDEAGKPMHSWRALILPFIDQIELHKLYDFGEPWNGSHNSALAHRMPQIFHCESEPVSDGHANYVVLVGPETPFPGSKSTSRADFEDGLDQTILLAEISNSTIDWLEPRDLDAATMSYRINDKSKPSISAARRNGPYVVFADHISTRTLTVSLSPDALKALTTIRGHEVIFLAEVGGTIGGLMCPKLGPATDDDLKRFAEWPNVHELWLNRSRITDAGLAYLRKATNLRKLHLADTSITDGGLKHLEGLTEMEFLSLSKTQVTDAGVAELTRALPILRIDR